MFLIIVSYPSYSTVRAPPWNVGRKPKSFLGHVNTKLGHDPCVKPFGGDVVFPKKNDIWTSDWLLEKLVTTIVIITLAEWYFDGAQLAAALRIPANPFGAAKS